MKAHHDKVAIGRRIKQSREKLNLSQTDVAKSLGLRPQSVQQWEEGGSSPRGKRIQALSDLLQVNPYWLLFGVDISDGVSDKFSSAKAVLSSSEIQSVLKECLSEVVIESIDMQWLSVKNSVDIEMFGDMFLRKLRHHNALN